MKNFKRVLALVLAFVMVLSINTVAFAAEEVQNADKAEVLYDLGLFAGTSDSDFVPALEDGTNREQSMVMLAYLLGWDYEGAPESGFEDVSDWAAPYVNYAVATGVTVGVGSGNFGGDLEVSTREVATWIARELGYTEEGKDPFTDPELIIESGLVEAAELLLNGDDAINRDVLVGIFYDALTVENKNTGNTVIADLVEAGLVDGDKAEAYGLFDEDVDTDELEIVYVGTTNLKELTVEFNQDIEGLEDLLEEIEDEDNYTFEDEDGRALRSNGSRVEVEDVRVDGDTVVLVLKNAVENQEEGVLVVDSAILGYEEEFEVIFEDFDIPVVDDAEVIGVNTIKVTFSEPMNITNSRDRNKFTVESADGRTNYRVANIIPQANERELLIDVRSDFEDEAEVVLKIANGLEDFAGFRLVRTEIDMVVVEDDRDIEVIGYRRASEEGITLILNKDVKFEDTDEQGTTTDEDILKLFYHTNTRNTADEVKIDGNEIRLSFTDKDNELPTGTAYVYIDGEALVDYWNNENDTIRTEVQITADTEAPTINDVEYEDRVITVTFNKNLDDDTAEDEDNYTILTEDGDEVKDTTIRRADLDGSRVVELTLRGDELSPGKYILVVEDVEDTRGNAIDSIEEEFTVESSGFRLSQIVDEMNLYTETRGTGSNAYTIYTITVEYDSAMETGNGRYSIENLDNYVINFDDNSSYSLSELDEEEDDFYIDFYLVDNKNVEITIETEENVEPVSVTFSRLADSQGTRSTDLSDTLTFDSSDNKVEVDWARLVDTDEIRVRFKTPIEDFAAEDFTVEDANGTLDMSRIRISNDGREITIELEDDLSYDAEGWTVEFVIKSNPDSVGRFGAELEATTVPVRDRVRPELDGIGDVELINNELFISLVFEEYVKVTGNNITGLVSGLTITNDDGDDLSYVSSSPANKQYTLNAVTESVYDENGDSVEAFKVLNVVVSADHNQSGYIEIEFDQLSIFTDIADNENVVKSFDDEVNLSGLQRVKTAVQRVENDITDTFAGNVDDLKDAVGALSLQNVSVSYIENGTSVELVISSGGISTSFTVTLS
ncbi:S-layer family protein [Natranaerovirga hydrolytica]|uniref:S-layer family protein n=1 Tax=Natranaerovirga hydrolytica TaxID=680378 RepID=A0A4R1MKV9_9FIRM|nr:S-layer homology domain-containing protein [Natranaerovirga hydrolytica]TCK93125.1 S-layer family protein [Natranaerovirga hydrolytica]